VKPCLAELDRRNERRISPPLVIVTETGIGILEREPDEIG
jgi:hypothetical protein